MGNAVGQDLPPTHQGIFCETTALSPEIKLLFRTEREPGAAGCGEVRSSNFKETFHDYQINSSRRCWTVETYRSKTGGHKRSREEKKSYELWDDWGIIFGLKIYFCISCELLYSFISKIRKGEMIFYESSEGKVGCRRGTTTEIIMRIYEIKTTKHK